MAPQAGLRDHPAKSCKRYQNNAKWTPMGGFGNTLELEKRHQHAQNVLFCMRVLGVYFRRPPGSHFVRNQVRMTWQKLCLDCTGVRGSHTGHFRKKLSRDAFVYHSDVVSDAWQSHSADFWLKKPSSLAGRFGFVVGAMGTAGNQQQITSGRRAKSV